MGDITDHVALDLCSAIKSYYDGDYESAVELNLPIRYDVPQLGGSYAQVMNYSLFN